MSVPRFTRGEWRIGGFHGELAIIAEYPSETLKGMVTDQVIANVYGLTNEEVDANLKVMAASKTLYLACEAYQAADDHYDKCEDCQAAESWCEIGVNLMHKAVGLRGTALDKVGGMDHEHHKNP